MNLFMKTVLLIWLAFCAGCTPAQQVKVQQDIEKVVAPIQATTLADAQAALAIAVANNDQLPIPCYTDLVNYLANPLTLPTINGPISLLEQGRVGVHIPDALHRDCAFLILDAPTTALKLGLPVR